MKSYNEILEDLGKIAEDLRLTGDAVELNKRIAAYVYYHSQIDITNAVRERSMNTAFLMNSKIAACMDNMYSVFRGTNPILTANGVVTAEVGFNKFEEAYSSNTFKLYASQAYSYKPDTEDSNKIQSLQFIVSKEDLLDISLNKASVDATSWPYYIDLKLDTKVLASDLSEHIYFYDEETGNEINWTRIFTEHAASQESDRLLFVLTLPDYGIRIYRKGNFRDNDKIHIKVIPYSCIRDINLFDMRKVVIDGLTLRSKNYQANRDDESYNQTINVSDEGDYKSSGLNRDNFKMWLYTEVARQDKESLPYQANFSGRSSASIISNNDILFLFSETFINRILSCNFEASPTGDQLNIYYVQNPNADEISDNEKSEFLNKYDKYSLANSVSAISEGNVVNLNIGITFVSNGSVSIAEDVKNICDRYNNKLGQTLNLKEFEAQVNKLTGVSYVESISVVGSSETVFELAKSQYFNINVTLNQVI